MTKSLGLRPRIALGFGVALVLAVTAACSSLDHLVDRAFPPTVPGLPADQPWVFLPVTAWVTESGIEADAIAACFAPACKPRVAVGLFHTAGRDAASLSDIVAHPRRLQRELERGGRKRFVRRPSSKTVIRVERRDAGAVRGLAARLARADGGHAAYGFVNLVPRGTGQISVVLVIGEDEEAVRRIAAGVTAQLL